jgi:hypothetical protein
MRCEGQSEVDTSTDWVCAGSWVPPLHHFFLRTNWQRVRPPLLEHQPKPARPSYQPVLLHFRARPKWPPQVEGTISASTVNSVVLGIGLLWVLVLCNLGIGLGLGDYGTVAILHQQLHIYAAQGADS